MLVVVDMQVGTTRAENHSQLLDDEWWKRHEAVVANIRILSQKMDTRFQVHTGLEDRTDWDVIPELEEVFQASGDRILKVYDDGSTELSRVISRDMHIYLCGMNTDACVFRTAVGLAYRGYWVTVVGDACWSVWVFERPRCHDLALESLGSVSRVRVVSTSAVR